MWQAGETAMKKKKLRPLVLERFAQELETFLQQEGSAAGLKRGSKKVSLE
jgi:hypothetical protein